MRNLIESNNVFQIANSGFKVLEKLLDELPLGVFKSSSEGKLEYLNEFLSRLLEGGAENTIKEKDLLRNQISRQVEVCVKSDKPLSARMKDPKDFNLFVHIFPVRDETGKPTGALGWLDNLSGMTDLQAKLQKKINELSILCELGKVLRSTLNLEEILQIILIGVTAEQGLGFNRAFLLLLNQPATRLEGKMAIGPSNPEEAKRIWDALSAREQSLEDILHSYKDALKDKDILVNQIVKKLKIPLSDERNPLIQSMLNKKAFSIGRGKGKPDENLFGILQTEQLAVAPLISKDKMLGVIVADNLITQKPIEDEEVKLLSICAHHASAAIESSQLYQKLAEKVSKLAEANRKIAKNSRRLLKVEKLSVLGQITSQVAHELRNPMTIIGGFARSVLKKMDRKSPDYEYIKIIAKETERMENVLNNVLNFSKPDKSHLKMVNINDLVDQTFEMMEPEINSTKISLVKFPSQNLSSVRANPDLIRQALLNIFRNAIWAMPQGGILSITTRQTDKFVRIEIKDTGFGISQENKSKIFDAFFTTKPEACGLGLTISSEIIKNHGGNIGVESAEGKGATFYIELPLADDQMVGESSAGQLSVDSNETQMRSIGSESQIES
jgi:signal transduction histidine kinase